MGGAMDVMQGRTASPILVVDDSSTIRRSAEIFLAQSGYSVVFAEDGFEGDRKSVV
jgi:twitching motility two-component system response regulator PilG